MDRYGWSEAQFTGQEKIEGNLDLSSLTSIPEGFNPTVGGYLYCPHTVNTKPWTNPILSWQDGKYISADGIFTEVLEKKGRVYTVKKPNSEKIYYLVSDGKHHAHGDTIEKAREDYRFKRIAEKLRSEPITKDTIVTMQHYRIVTGACEMGTRQWMESNLTPKQKAIAESKGMKAGDLLPLLEKSNAYGVQKFKELLK